MLNYFNYDVVVLGGGAAGLFCAFTAARRGRRVVVLDSSNKVGKKILRLLRYGATMNGLSKATGANTPGSTSRVTVVIKTQMVTSTLWVAPTM